MDNKNGGLKVHNKSMDASWATKMGDSKSARKIADRVMGNAAWATKMGDSKSSWAMGDAAWATENGVFEVHKDCIAAWARGDANKN